MEYFCIKIEWKEVYIFFFFFFLRFYLLFYYTDEEVVLTMLDRRIDE